MNGDRRVSRASPRASSNKSVTTWRVITSTLACAAVAVGGLNIWKYGDVFQSRADSEEAAPTQNGVQSPIAELPAELTELVSTKPGPWVSADQTENRYAIKGIVHDEETRTRIEESVEDVYGQFGISQITVESSVGKADWTDDLPAFIKEGATQFIDGRYAANNDGILVEGTFPDTQNADRLKAIATRIHPTLDFKPKVESLRDPEVKITVEDKTITLEGQVPSEEIRNEIGDIGLYPEVNNELVIDEDTYSLFRLRRIGDILTEFQSFKDYTLTISGQDLTSEISGGIVFDSGSAELSTEGTSHLEVFKYLMEQSSSAIEIVGHTDSQDEADKNLELSGKRANAVEIFLISQGIPEFLIEAEAKGESEPIADNKTEAGRSQNRRVEIRLVPLSKKSS